MKVFLAFGIAISLLLGIVIGIAGTGGAFIIPVLIYVFGIEQLKAQGTALLVAALPVWVMPFIPYYKSGSYDFRLALLLAIGVGVGGYWGAIWAQRLPVGLIRKTVALVLIVLAFQLFFTADPNP